MSRPPRIAIFDHSDSCLGGGQLVVGHMAAVLSRHYDVDIIHSGRGYSLGSMAAAFDLDLKAVNERKVPSCPASFSIPRSGQLRGSTRMARALSQSYGLFIYSGHNVPPFCYAPRGLIYSHFPTEGSPDHVVSGNSRWMERSAVDRMVRWAAYRMLWRKRMLGYPYILCNSQFTARWIGVRWRRAAEVLYPPVDLEVPAIKKRNVIVSIGRFDGSRRTKNQLGQVGAFRRFQERTGGRWQLRMIGSTGDREYVARVREAAKNSAVEFLLDADRHTVREVLAEAKLFWHTTGLPAEEEARPDEAEHFGIATVEAMRGGCVPIVIGSGGQREIVEDGVSGFLCNDIDEVAAKTIEIAPHDERLAVMSAHAALRSRLFSPKSFSERLTTIVSRYLAGSGAVRRP